MGPRLPCIRAPFLAAVLAASFWGRAASAAEGVIEINQARALAGGITAGDAPGLPVTIAASGSFRLTGDLDTAGGGAGIQVVAPARHVTIDLGGFAIVGPNVCTPLAVGVSCLLSGGPNAIDVDAAVRFSLRNGSLRGLRNGLVVVAAESVTVEEVVASHFSNTGIASTSSPTLVRRSVANLNGGRGFDLGALGRIVDSIADHNGNNGMDAAQVSGSSASANGSNGISASFPAGAVHACRATGNGSSGIVAGAGGRVSDSAAALNKIGVTLGAGATLLASSARDNTGFGLVGGVGSSYGGNTLTGNNAGSNTQVSGSATEIGTNFCATDTVCP